MAEEQSHHSPDENPPADATESDESEAAAECVDVEAVDAEAVDDEYLEELLDGSGCVEVWEYLAERRGDGE
jgi:hypothetical protein